jgi:hypothetical protein
MRWLMVILLVLPVVALAQQEWGGDQQLWCHYQGRNFSPCFGRDTSEIIGSFPLPVTSDPSDTVYFIFSLMYPSGEAHPILPESLPHVYSDVTPYLSRGSNRLYFSSGRNGGYGGYDIYYSEFDEGSWGFPINLGPNINTVHNEWDPSVTGDGLELYFIRSNHTWYNDYSGIICRSMFENSQWNPAESLEAPINSGGWEACPTISPDGGWLYFISRRDYWLDPWLAWVSHRIQDGWQEPTPLIGFINHYWEDVPGILEGAPGSLAVDSTGTTLLYGKNEISEQFDPVFCAYLAHQVTGVADDCAALPSDISLSAYPNPFNARTTISYSISRPGRVTIDIFDILGQRVARLEAGERPAGEHKAIWDAAGFPSGIYFARSSAGRNAVATKMMLLK